MQKLFIVMALIISVGVMWTWAAQAQDTRALSGGRTDFVSVHVESNSAEKVNKLVIMLTGADKTQTRLVEDALAIQLLRRSTKVVSRLRVERLLAEEMVKYRARREKKDAEAIHASVIAKRAGATGILVGTVHNEPRPEVRAKSDEKDTTLRMVRCISLQLLGVENEEILWTACAEFDDSASYNEIAKQLIADLVKE